MSTEPWTFATLPYRSATLRYATIGDGTPYLFQHGLGADCRQGLSALLPLVEHGFRLIAIDCPGHGESSLSALDGTPNFERFIDLLMTCIDTLELDEFCMGGISMGASLTLGVAQRLQASGHSDRLRAMTLVRPAWIDQTDPGHLGIISKLGHWIEDEGIAAASTHLEGDPLYQSLLPDNPRCAASIAGVLSRGHAVEHAPTLYHMVASQPLADLASLAAISTPALIITNDGDPLHPPEIGQTWQQHLPQAEIAHIAARYLDPETHQVELNTAIRTFLQRYSQQAGTP